MSGEALRNEIRKSAEAQAEKILSEARSKAAEALAEAESSARLIHERKGREARARAELEKGSGAARVRLECRKRVLLLRAKYVAEAFARAESLVKGLPESRPDVYARVLKRLIAEGADALGTAELTLVVRAPDRGVAEKGFAATGGTMGGPGGFRLSDVPLEAAGGVVLHADDRRLYYVNTFESRLRQAQEELRAKVASALLRGEKE